MKFKVGDRVAVYGYVSRYGRSYRGARGEVVGFDTNNFLLVTFDQDSIEKSSYSAHPKQCRRLVKKKPRRRVWLGPATVAELDRDTVSSQNRVYSERPPYEGWVEFVEVRSPRGLKNK